MSETVAGAVARVEATSGYQLVQASADEFGRALPAHIGPDRFTRWALTVLRKPELARVLAASEGQLSVMAALMDCASLGLEPGREYHLVPFGNTVTGITDYKGEIRLISNWEPCSVIAQLVHAKDDFVMTGANIPPRHDADWFGDRGPVTGGYSYVDYGGGRYSLVNRMSEADFARHRNVARTKSVWDEWPEPMRLKTLIHGTRKMVPWAPERRW